MKDLWKKTLNEKPKKGTIVLIWDSKKKRFVTGKHNDVVWRCCCSQMLSFTYGTHWMPVVAPDPITEDMGDRECVTCKRKLPVESFGKDKRNVDEIMRKCKDCVRDYQKTAGYQNTKSHKSAWVENTIAELNSYES